MKKAAELTAKEELELTSYIGWLEDTLIPDLHESGTDATAEDFERCVKWMRELAGIGN